MGEKDAILAPVYVLLAPQQMVKADVPHQFAATEGWLILTKHVMEDSVVWVRVVADLVLFPQPHPARTVKLVCREISPFNL